MNSSNVVFWTELVYALVLLGTILKIIIDTKNPVKSLGYILAAIFIPVVGIIIYFSVGVNYRKQKIYKRKDLESKSIYKSIRSTIFEYSRKQIKMHTSLIQGKESIVHMLLNDSTSPLCETTDVKLLINGETKFPELIKHLKKARHHIHMEYYIFSDDIIGNQIKDLLIQKAKEGVQVRFIFDDFGSHRLNKRILKELRDGGVETYAFYKVRLYALANRLNYRNHRKIVVIDGDIGFIGGINVDDRYINNGKHAMFWRDTHLMIKGQAVIPLQYTFMNDWYFCSNQELPIQYQYFPLQESHESHELVQIATSGPDSTNASIMLSCLGIIMNSRQRLYITSPYFIPNDTIVDALKHAALSGVDVKLLVPGVSDSMIVNLASCSYYEDLLKSGVRIFQYQKGFVHSKTIVSDHNLSVIGSANMDIRSFDLNFEINALIFSTQINSQLYSAFIKDLDKSNELNIHSWNERSSFKKFLELISRLLSPLL